MNGNNYTYIYIYFLVPLVPFLLSSPFYSLFFPSYILLFSSRRKEKIRFVRAEIFSKPSLYHRAAKKSLWRSRNKFLGNCSRHGIEGGEKKIESGQRSRSSISSKILFDRCRSSKNRTTVNGKSFFPIYFPSGNGRRTIQFFDSSSL